MIYKGNAKIRDIGNFGVFYGNSPIRQVFKGSELVYQYHPFEPQSIIINKSESITVEHNLPQGRYYVECVGGGRGGVGGTVSSNTSVSGITFSNVVNRNGNNGNYNGDAGSSTVKGAASVASTGNYGASSDANTGNAGSGVAGVNGWIFLKYLGAI